MKYFIDSEFVDTGSTIDLISIGLVAEDGRELYLQSVEFAWEAASEWVRANVYPHLQYCSPNAKRIGGTGTIQLSKVFHQGIAHEGEHTPLGQCSVPDCPWRTREQIKREILSFMDIEQYDPPELWGWCSGYDFVAFCQLFGTMMDLPTGYPHYIHDLQQVLDDRNIPDDLLPLQEEGLHNALADAQHLKKLWGYIVRNDCWQ